MPLRRLSDYTGLAIWGITLIFVLGSSYAQQKHNTESLLDTEAYKARIDLHDKDIVQLRMQLAYQQRWQGDFMKTFKELVKEMKTTNEQGLKNSYQLKSIEREIKNATKYK